MSVPKIESVYNSKIRAYCNIYMKRKVEAERYLKTLLENPEALHVNNRAQDISEAKQAHALLQESPEAAIDFLESICAASREVLGFYLAKPTTIMRPQTGGRSGEVK